MTSMLSRDISPEQYPAPPVGAAEWLLGAGGMTRDERRRVVAHDGGPAGAAAATWAARVPAKARDVRPGVPAVGEDRDPVAAAGLAPDLEAGRVERAGEEPSPMQRIADGARAVVAARAERSVGASPDVGQVVDLVGRLDHAADGERGVRGRDGVTVRVERRVAGRRRDLREVRLDLALLAEQGAEDALPGIAGGRQLGLLLCDLRVLAGDLPLLGGHLIARGLDAVVGRLQLVDEGRDLIAQAPDPRDDLVVVLVDVVDVPGPG